MHEISLCKGFGEDVNNLLHGWTILEINDLPMNQVLHVVHMNFNVLGPLLVNHILRDLDSALIITKDDSSLTILNTKLSENMLQPYGFCYHIYKY